MPYYLHDPDRDPVLSGEEFATKAAAGLARKSEPKKQITFVIDRTSWYRWRYRERQRFADQIYLAVPWAHEGWVIEDHFVHLSVVHPALIAYTPDDEYGVQDRQLRVRPGKYLSTYAPEHLSIAQRDGYCAQCRAATGQAFALATTADDIEQVYVNGPDSCMGGSGHTLHDFCTEGIHPTRAYAGGDLAVAYLGSPESHITARAVVWPERHIFSRVYGDPALGHLLQAAGYASGKMTGARLSLIHTSDKRIIRPYIDGISYGKVHDGHLILGEGRISTELTTGAEDDDHDEDGWTCAGCGRRHRPDDDNYYTIHLDNYCPSCEEEFGAYCALCGGRYYAVLELSREACQSRIERRVAALCLSCADRHTYCAYCDDHYLTASADGLCPVCSPPADADAPEEGAEEDAT